MGEPNMFFDLCRTLFRYIDFVVYWLVGLVYQLIIMISEVSVFGPDTIEKFAGRIYALLGIFMLFKVTFSLITYILNPDNISDKSKGMGKLLTNFFVVLIGIVAVPYVFQAAYSLQGIVLKENVIGNIVLGMSSGAENGSGKSYIKQGGDMMAFSTLSAFVRLNPNLVGDACSDNPVIVTKGSNGGREVELSSDCKGAHGMDALVNNGNEVDTLIVRAYEENNISLLTVTDAVNLKAQNKEGAELYVFDYTILISTVAGGFLAWILLLFCIDIALRSVKLGFLQLIAPIPIISYVDPKGQGMFNKWLKECGKTYADLFIRLVAIYFVIFIISELDFANGFYNVASGEQETMSGMFFVKVFIIFGALMFAKQLPQLLENLLGFKFSGDGFTLNPMKKLGSSPYAAGLVGAVGGAVGGLAANTWALGSKMHKGWKGVGAEASFGQKLGGAFSSLTDGFSGAAGARKVMGNLFSGVAGAGSAGFRGMTTGLTSGGKGSAWAAASKGVQGSNQARFNRDVYAGDPDVPDSKYGWGQRRIDDINKFAGVKNKDAGVGKYDQQMKKLKRDMDNYQSQENALRESMAKFQAASGRSFADFDSEKLYKYDANGARVKDGNGNYEYVDFTGYSGDGGVLTETLFNEFLNYQRGIDHYDQAYEEARRKYGKYEDAYKSRNAAKNDKQ